MKKGVETHGPDSAELVDKKKEANADLNLEPSTGTKEKYKERGDKAKEARLRGDFAARAEGLKEEFKGTVAQVAGEKYVLNFTSLQKDGKNVEKAEDLKKEAEDKNFNLDRVSGQFNLVKTGEGKENLNLTYSLPIKKILSCDTPAALKQLITGSFAGTDDYYKKMQASGRAIDTANAPKETAIPRASAEKSDKKEAKMEEIKKAAAKTGGNVSILEGKSFSSIIVKMSESRQIHLASTDLAVWSVGEVQNGKMTGKSTTENPIEFIRPAEKEANA